jgi:hypothetical protein
MTIGTTQQQPLTLPAGQHLGIEEDSLSFEVLDNGVEAQGLSENNRERYLIKVKFAEDKLVVFRCESKSLKTAFEMIEMVGQQTKDLDSAKFKEYLNSVHGKRIWVDMTNISEHPGFKTDRVIAYEENRHGNALQYAFPKAKGFTPVISINNDLLGELKRLAKQHQMQPDASRDLNRHDVRVVLKKKEKEDVT